MEFMQTALAKLIAFMVLVAIAAFIFWILKNPIKAADFITGIFGGVIDFVQRLLNGFSSKV